MIFNIMWSLHIAYIYMGHLKVFKIIGKTNVNARDI